MNSLLCMRLVIFYGTPSITLVSWDIHDGHVTAIIPFPFTRNGHFRTFTQVSNQPINSHGKTALSEVRGFY